MRLLTQRNMADSIGGAGSGGGGGFIFNPPLPVPTLLSLPIPTLLLSPPFFTCNFLYYRSPSSRMRCTSKLVIYEVSEKKAKDRCASKGNIPYFETSAKEDYNVDAAFLCIAKTTLANEHEQDMSLIRNRLNGSILTEFDDIVSFVNLLLSANNFTGTVPELFVNLKNLTDFTDMEGNENILLGPRCYFPNFVYVTFASVEDAKNALSSEHVLGNRMLEVKVATSN
ncbi:Ras-related protein Rab7 [Senna tora]|uniref:Ras-related protein Rab7 n=1 Tax=Senna tora TaxID=362788 RepID=A0A834XFZ9_9FABA|nr:Ras-related protein Rab7 [Senna tora]